MSAGGGDSREDVAVCFWRMLSGRNLAEGSAELMREQMLTSCAMECTLATLLIRLLLILLWCRLELV